MAATIRCPGLHLPLVALGVLACMLLAALLGKAGLAPSGVQGLRVSKLFRRCDVPSVAMCGFSKDEPDIREWALYHLALGVEHIFIRDMESTPPLTDTLADLVAAGSVTVARRRPTLSGLAYVAEEYTLCLKGARDYEWIVFIDTDEYIVLYDNTASLPALLKEYRAYPSLRIQWRMFGSSGWVERPPNGMLRSYTACEPLPHPNFKSIVQPKQVTAVKNAHDFNYTQASREPARACTAEDCPRVWIHHYFTRSREDWTHKVKRGDRGGFPRKMEDFDAWDAKSIANCTRGLEAFAKFLPEGLSTTHF